MIIRDINLDDLDRFEYLNLLYILLNYYYICFCEELVLEPIVSNNE